MNDADGTAALDLDLASDSTMWAKLLSKGAAGQTPAAFTPTVTARLKGGGKASLHGDGDTPSHSTSSHNTLSHNTQPKPSLTELILTS